jgi:hypothetical protein
VLFVIPPLTLLSAAGWDSALDLTASRVRLAVGALLVLGMLEPLVFQIRNHPNQIVYFNPLSGGPRAAFNRYEMDYWGNSVLQAVKWAAALSDRAGEPVTVSGNQIVQGDAQRFHSLAYVPRGRAPFHLDIRLLRGPRAAVKEAAERPDALFRVTTADGTPLTVVLPGPAYGELQERLNKIASR